MKKSGSILPLIVVLGVIILGAGLLNAFAKYRLDLRWLGAIIVLALGFVGYKFTTNHEEFLLKIMIFTIPFAVGFGYVWVVKEDGIFAFDVVLSIMFVLWFFETNGFKNQKFFFNKLGVVALMLIGWSSLSIIPSISRFASGYGVYILVKVLIIFIYVTNRIATRRKVKIVIDYLLYGLAIQGFMGAAQKAVGHSLGLGFLGETARSFTGNLQRIRGTFGFPNMFGAYLILLLPISMSLFVFTKNPKKKFWHGVVSLVCLITLFFTLSRSSWFGIIFAIIVMTVVITFKMRGGGKLFFTMVIFLLIIGAMAAIFWDIIMLRFDTGEDGRYRFRMIDISKQIIASNPILGVGLYNYEFHSHKYFRYWKPVHNEYYRLTAETGFPGVLLFLYFIFLVYKNAFTVLKYRDPYFSALAIGIIGGYSAFMLAVLFGPQFQHYRQHSIFWLLGGLTVSMLRILRAKKLKQKRQMQTRAYIDLESESTKGVASQDNNNGTGYANIND